MAKKKASSQAEKIVTDTKRKAPPAKSNSKKKPPKKAANSKKAPKVGTEYENPVSTSLVTALISFCLFLLFVLICVKPEGALLMVVKSVVLGLVGRAGFYFLIPALLYMALINLFGRKMAVRLRGTCAIAFALLCGVIYHLVVAQQVQNEPMQLLGYLYSGGTAGTSGGVVCGLTGYLLRWACGTALSYIITMLLAVLTLLGAMQITIPSLIRAIANRPRDDYEEDEEDDYIEPAAIVVNKIATRQIEQKRQRREQAKQQPAPPQRLEEPAQERMPEPPKPKKEKKQEVQEPAPQPQPMDTVKHAPGKGAAFMSRIDVEISAPLAGTSRYVREDIPSVFDEPVAEVTEEPLSLIHI